MNASQVHPRALRHGPGHRPTGSGKTKTLYAALSEIKTVEDKIIHDRGSGRIPPAGITQIPINEKKA